MTGPTMLPMMKELPHSEDTRPRIDGGASRTTSAIAEMVNMVEPRPPSPRKTSSCQ